MTVQELREKNQQLATVISAALREYQEQTGLTPVVEIIPIGQIHGEDRLLVSVKAVVR